MPKIKTEPKSIKAQTHRGSRSAFEDGSVGEEYIQIWIQKMYFKISDWDLAKKFECSYSKIKRALEWVNKNFIKIPNKVLLRGAIFSIEERIRHLTELIEIERTKDVPSVRSIVELNREIREENRDLLKLQNLYKERYDIEIDSGGSIRDILKALSAEK